jgi:hypothetical protein
LRYFRLDLPLILFIFLFPLSWFRTPAVPPGHANLFETTCFDTTCGEPGVKTGGKESEFFGILPLQPWMQHNFNQF